MNKEVEEAKELLKEIRRQDMLDDIGPNESKAIEVLLNYIRELEKTISKERILAEVQTTYDINEMWQQKIRDKIEELKNKGVYQGNGYYCSGAILILQKLLEKEE